MPQIYNFAAPIFTPSPWTPLSKLPTQDEYNDIFYQEYPELRSILPRKNVCVCGGSAAWPLSKNSHQKPSDIDFFVHGLPNEISDEGRFDRWDCVDGLMNAIRSEFAECVEAMSPGIITIEAFRRKEHDPTQSKLKLQIILRAYFSASATLHGFDVPSCCVSFDGQRTYTTSLGAYAHILQANVVNPAYRSTTYEKRLVKYFKRGFALMLPHLDMNLLQANHSLT
jgi:hypothetical protein